MKLVRLVPFLLALAALPGSAAEDPEALRESFLARLNQERLAAGLPPLRLAEPLSRVAQQSAEEIRDRPFAVDVPGGFTGKGRVVLFANNQMYRWQNHGEFNMVFNALLNWNDLGTQTPTNRPTTIVSR